MLEVKEIKKLVAKISMKENGGFDVKEDKEKLFINILEYINDEYVSVEELKDDEYDIRRTEFLKGIIELDGFENVKLEHIMDIQNILVKDFQKLIESKSALDKIKIRARDVILIGELFSREFKNAYSYTENIMHGQLFNNMQKEMAKKIDLYDKYKIVGEYLSSALMELKCFMEDNDSDNILLLIDNMLIPTYNELYDLE